MQNINANKGTACSFLDCTRRLTHPSLLDDGVILGENIVFVLGPFDRFSSVFQLFSSYETMTSSKSMGVGRVIRWTRNSAERFENYYYESLAFSWQTIDLAFDEETMKPERFTEALENAGVVWEEVRPWTSPKLRLEFRVHFP